MAEYWVPESLTVCGRISITNRGSQVEKLDTEWVSLLTPLEEGRGMAVVQFGMNNVLEGKTGDLTLVCFLSSGAQPGTGPFPGLVVENEILPGESQRLTWALAARPDAEASFKAARAATGRAWDAEIAQVERLNDSQWLEITTGDPAWNAAFALSQKIAWTLFYPGNARLPFHSFVLNRQPDQGFSPRGDGSDYAYSVFVGADGYVYAAGSSDVSWGSPIRSFTSLDDAFAAKLDGNGTLIWMTFLGGSNSDYAYAIAADGGGNVIVAGQTYSAWGSPVRAYTAACDGFVAKLTSSGALTWNTFLGGSGNDYIHYGLALDASGGIFVAGTSATSWGTPVRAYTASDDAFVVKLDTAGNVLWNTFLGGSGSDYGMDIALDAGGGIYLAGTGDASWGSPVRAYSADADAFVVKLDAGGALVWNTFLGGSGTDYGYSVAVDGNGKVYVGGHSAVSWGTPERAFTATYDAYAAKLDADGALLWNTFLGGSGDDRAYTIAVDNIGNVFLGGYSSASWGAPVRAYSSGNDAFVAKVSGSMNIVHLLSFSAALAADRVDLSWATAYETNCAGFHLWRGDVLGGPYARITSTLIPAEGGPTKGASYSYQDYSAAAGRAYFYKLEAVDFSGQSDLFGPVASFSASEAIVPLTPLNGGAASAQEPPRFTWTTGAFSLFQIELCPDASFGADTIVWPFDPPGHLRSAVENRWITEPAYVPRKNEWIAACPPGPWNLVYWRVRAKDAIGRQIVSAVFQLRVF